MRHHVFVCTTGYGDHWARVVAEHRAHAKHMTEEERERRRRERPEHSDGHYGAHCGETIGGDLYEAFKAKLADRNLMGEIAISPNACIAQHAAGPMIMVYPDAIWYRVHSMDEIDEIIDSHLVAGTPVERLVHRRLDLQSAGAGVEVGAGG